MARASPWRVHGEPRTNLPTVFSLLGRLAPYTTFHITQIVVNDGEEEKETRSLSRVYNAGLLSVFSVILSTHKSPSPQVFLTLNDTPRATFDRKIRSTNFQARMLFSTIIVAALASVAAAKPLKPRTDLDNYEFCLDQCKDEFSVCSTYFRSQFSFFWTNP